MMWMVLLPLSIIAIVLILRFLNYTKAKSSSDNSLDILKKRYAKGEITTEEFEEAKRVLK